MLDNGWCDAVLDKGCYKGLRRSCHLKGKVKRGLPERAYCLYKHGKLGQENGFPHPSIYCEKSTAMSVPNTDSRSSACYDDRLKAIQKINHSHGGGGSEELMVEQAGALWGLAEAGGNGTDNQGNADSVSWVSLPQTCLHVS